MILIYSPIDPLFISTASKNVLALAICLDSLVRLRGYRCGVNVCGSYFRLAMPALISMEDLLQAGIAI